MFFHAETRSLQENGYHAGNSISSKLCDCLTGGVQTQHDLILIVVCSLSSSSFMGLRIYGLKRPYSAAKQINYIDKLHRENELVNKVIFVNRVKLL